MYLQHWALSVCLVACQQQAAPDQYACRDAADQQQIVYVQEKMHLVERLQETLSNNITQLGTDVVAGALLCARCTW